VLNASSLQYFRSVKRFIASLLRIFTLHLTLHHHYFFKQNYCWTLHHCYFFAKIHQLTLHQPLLLISNFTHLWLPLPRTNFAVYSAKPYLASWGCYCCNHYFALNPKMIVHYCTVSQQFHYGNFSSLQCKGGTSAPNFWDKCTYLTLHHTVHYATHAPCKHTYKHPSNYTTIPTQYTHSHTY
jgi:hypothetical protein